MFFKPKITFDIYQCEIFHFILNRKPFLTWGREDGMF